MHEAVIVSAVRTPNGRFLGSLKEFAAPELGAMVVREAVRRARVDPAMVDQCIMGNVVASGTGQAPARQAALHGGLSPRTGALTINKVCGSGLKAVMLAAQGIATGDVDVVVAGGMESMSNYPHLLPRVREGLRIGHGEVIDSMLRDGLWCAFENWHMGNAAECIASECRIGRAQQDEYAFESHRRAAAAAAAGHLANEILPITISKSKTGESATLGSDESVRPDIALASLGTLRPAFAEGGTVTAGNSSLVSDGAAALVVMSHERARHLNLSPMARIVGQVTSGREPRYVLVTPIDAVRLLLKKIGWRLDDVDVIELNEAFAVQSIAVIRQLGLDPARVNVSGGAVALGHPIGASGARILTTLLYALKRRQARRGIATLCLGGGNAVAVAVECA